MNQGLPPTVCLNGTAVRNIREEKKLTQLYVSKVVGVTTDTISRWENNRYPSVKRENALRLAEALEVPVEEILQPLEESAPADCPPAGNPRIKAVLLLAAVGLLLLGGGGYFTYFYCPSPMAVPRATRLLPKYAAPGSIIPVRIRVKAGSETKGFILGDHFPQGWRLIEANPPPSSLDNEKGSVRWILKPGAKHPLISYLLKVASKAKIGEVREFKGEVVGNPDCRNAPSAVGGASRIRVDPYQWADQNGDDVIEDGEILQAYDIVDEMKGVHLDWKLLKKIWDAGGYRWEARRKRFLPVRPPSTQTDSGQKTKS